jgi:hypothetical protein
MDSFGRHPTRLRRANLKKERTTLMKDRESLHRELKELKFSEAAIAEIEAGLAQG